MACFLPSGRLHGDVDPRLSKNERQVPSHEAERFYQREDPSNLFGHLDSPLQARSGLTRFNASTFAKLLGALFLVRRCICTTVLNCIDTNPRMMQVWMHMPCAQRETDPSGSQLCTCGSASQKLQQRCCKSIGRVVCSSNCSSQRCPGVAVHGIYARYGGGVHYARRLGRLFHNLSRYI